MNYLYCAIRLIQTLVRIHCQPLVADSLDFLNRIHWKYSKRFRQVEHQTICKFK